MKNNIIIKEAYYLKGIDECQVVKCDVIVIILDIAECLLVILHKGIDLTILTLQMRTSNSYKSDIKLLQIVVSINNITCKSFFAMTLPYDYF